MNNIVLFLKIVIFVLISCVCLDVAQKSLEGKLEVIEFDLTISNSRETANLVLRDQIENIKELAEKCLEFLKLPSLKVLIIFKQQMAINWHFQNQFVVSFQFA
jgi:hypothetical protein